MANWIEVYETNDFSPLLKRGKLDRFAVKTYEMISDQIVDVFGISTDYLKMLKLAIKIEELYEKQLRTGDRSGQLVIGLMETELDALKNKPSETDFFASIASMEKYMQLRLNSKEITVYEFYQYSKFVSKSLKTA